jgi:hypothetical protein
LRLPIALLTVRSAPRTSVMKFFCSAMSKRYESMRNSVLG